MNHKPFGGRIAALFLALAAAVLMAAPVFANWCTHVYGSRHAYETQYDADGEVTGQHLTRTTCAFCGAVNVHLPEDDPNYGKDVALPEDCEYEDTVIEPTCTEGGYTIHTCVKCGGSYRDSFTEPLDHEFGEGETVLHCSCNSEGLTEKRCVRCGYHLLEAVSPEGHTPGEPATCTDPCLCTVCGAVLELPACHDYETETVPPTCTDFGYTRYVCRTCGDERQSDFLPPLGHKESAWIIDKEPDFSVTGLRHKECELCHTVLITETIDRLYRSVRTDNHGEAAVGQYSVTVLFEKDAAPVQDADVTLEKDGSLTVVLPRDTGIDYADPVTVIVLLTADGSPVEAVPVTVSDSYDNRCSGLTDKDGRITVPEDGGSTDRDGRLTFGFKDGDKVFTYTVTVVNRETGRPIRDAKISVDRDGRLKIDLPDGVDLDENHRILVTVKDRRGDAAEGVVILMTNDLKHTAEGKTDKDGSVLLPADKAEETGAKEQDKTADGTEKTDPEKPVTERHSAYLVGYPDGTFGPERNMSHAEAVTIFARLLSEHRGETVPNAAKTGFRDVPEDAWYAGYVKYLSDCGVIASSGSAALRPDDPITRAEFVTLAVKFFEQYGDGSETLMREYVEFTDVSSGYWAARYIEDAAAHGWIKGYEDGTFGGEREITRAEVVTVVNRLLNRSADETALNSRSVTRFTDLPKSHWAYFEIMEAANAHTALMKDGEIWQ